MTENVDWTPADPDRTVGESILDFEARLDEAEMTPAPLAEHDIVRVHPGVIVDGRNLGGVLLTVTAVSMADVDGTVSTGDRPVHLGMADVDLVYHFGGIR